MKGIGSAPKSGGGTIYTSVTGRRWEVAPNGQITRYSGAGIEARFNAEGRPAFIRDDRRGITIQRESGIQRAVTSERPGQVRIVSYSANRGYVQRPLRAGFVQRTYVYGNNRSISVYGERFYRGHTYYHYETPVYYEPSFYSWLLAAWAQPIGYDWGFSGQGWYGINSSYFTPAETYGSPSEWMADNLVADTLRENDHSPDSPEPDYPATSPKILETNATPITPTVRTAIAGDISEQLKVDAAEATGNDSSSKDSQHSPDILDPNSRSIFVTFAAVGSLRDGSICKLTGGDYIVRTSDSISTQNTLDVFVISNKAGDCPSQKLVAVDADTLQEMYNGYSRKIHEAPTVIGRTQGTHGMPSTDAPANGRVLYASSVSNTNADAALVQQQEQLANQSEMEAQVSAHSPSQ